MDTRIGVLESADGAPSRATVERVYDHLEFLHGVNALLNAFPGASTYAIRQGFISAGAEGSHRRCWLPKAVAPTGARKLHARSAFVSFEIPSDIARALLD